MPGLPGGSNYGTTPGSSIPSVTLDAFAESHPPPALIKIDVEGGEADVLRGARRLLAEHRPVVLCDLHGEALRDEVRSLLEGYRVEELGSPWRIVARPAAAG